jgi:hypothetical protein
MKVVISEDPALDAGMESPDLLHFTIIGKQK